MRSFLRLCKVMRSRYSMWKYWPIRSRRHEVLYWLREANGLSYGVYQTSIFD
jgi:hypothetical protein